MNTDDPVVILSVARTPMGSFNGELKNFSASDLGAISNRAALERSLLDQNEIDEVIMGCVLSAGQGQAPARQSSMKAGFSESVSCTTVNKMCGSGMKAVMLASDSISSGTNDVIIAGGMESMSNSPYILPKSRFGYRMGHDKVLDHMFLDGLEDAYDKGKLMGSFAEDCAEKYNFSRDLQDNFSIDSVKKAKSANQNGKFAWEIIPVQIKRGKDQYFVERDEQPFKSNIEKIPSLKPAFKDKGTVTAANSSSISDGAASICLSKFSYAKKRGIKPLAKIVGYTSFAQEPSWFTTAPIGAIKKLYKKINWDTENIDLFEINEAFAVVTLATIKELNILGEKVNINGGACALGHPIGASGARIIVSLIGALKERNLQKGVASLCIGGGEATAMAIELI